MSYELRPQGVAVGSAYIHEPTEGEDVLIQDAYHLVVVLAEIKRRFINNANKYSTHGLYGPMVGMVADMIQDAEHQLGMVAAELVGLRG